MTRSFLNGNLICFIDDAWRYAWGGDVDRDNPRPCPKCNMTPTEEGHDACLKNLPGVKAACCGHGKHEGYVRFDDDTEIRGVFTITSMTFIDDAKQNMSEGAE
jgi:hypothetical protein